MHNCLATFKTWSSRRWIAAVMGSLITYLFIALTTALIPNPIFGRAVDVTSWAIEAAAITSVLSGLLFATYVKDRNFIEDDRTAKVGGIGTFLAYFAVACPVCNKIVLLAVGTTGALQWFAPVQPYLAIAGIGILLYALRKRLTAESMCAIPAKGIKQTQL